MPIGYHFRDCKAQLLTSLTHVNGAVADLYLHLMCVCPSLFGPIVAQLRVTTIINEAGLGHALHYERISEDISDAPTQALAQTD